MALSFSEKFACAVTAQVGPVYKGFLNKGTNGVPTRVGAGNYTIPTDALTLMTLLTDAKATDLPVACNLTNTLQVALGAIFDAGNQTIHVKTDIGGAATDVDFGVFVLSTSPN